MRLMPLTIVCRGRGWMHFSSSGSRLPVGSVADRLVVADPDRIARIEADDAADSRRRRRHAVAGGGHDEGLVEADLERAGLDLAVPVGAAVAEAEVPLADDARGVAGLLQQRRQRERPGSMISAASPGRMPVPFLPPGVLAGQQRVARRRAGRGRRVAVGERRPSRRAGRDAV